MSISADEYHSQTTKEGADVDPPFTEHSLSELQMKIGSSHAEELLSIVHAILFMILIPPSQNRSVWCQANPTKLMFTSRAC